MRSEPEAVGRQIASRRHRALCLILAGCAILAGAGVARAQGYLYQFGRYHWTVPVPVRDGYVDASNGNLHLQTPLASIPERGHVPYTAALVYDSHIWQEVGSSGSISWQPTNVPGSWGGWRLATSDGTGSVSYTTETKQVVCRIGGIPVIEYYNVYKNFQWQAPDGHTISFPAIGTQESTDCTGGTSSGSANDSDQWGYHMYVTAYTSATVYAADGTQVFPTVKDTNGNSVNTLSTSSPLTASTNGNTTTYTFVNSAGSSYTYTVTTESINVNTNFGVSGVTEYSGSLTVVKSISLTPGDGGTYTWNFSYDSGTSPGYYGTLTGMTLPEGGQVAYSYANFQDALGETNRFLESYTAGGGAWTFAPQVISTSCSTSCQQDVTIARPNDSGGGDNEVYTFTFQNSQAVPLDTEQQYHSGSSTLLKTVTVSYSGDLPSTITTTLPVPGGSIGKKTQITYDSSGFGNTVEQDEWNFYSGSPPASPYRRILYTYLTNSDNNMVNKKASITVESAGGTVAASTTITYDDYSSHPLTSVTGAIGHDDANFGTSYTARGNPTEITRSTGTTNLTTTYTYDTTGKVRSIIDPRGYTTTIGYTDNYYTDESGGPTKSCSPGGATDAFPTSITPPTSGAISLGYYCKTGQRALVTDQNQKTTSFNYDAWDRPTSTAFPDSGSSQVSYPFVTEVDVSQLISSTLGSVVTQAIQDSWGRQVESILQSDPNGATKVDTGYDGQSRTTSVTNPYRQGDTVYSTTVGYDGLGRRLATTQPDGHTASLSYGAQLASGSISSQLCSTATYGIGYPEFSVDAADKEREVWTDAFGRLIEVDEPDSGDNLTKATCYTYDLNGDLTGVLAPTGQTRSYAYDEMGRVTSATAPESGTTTYTYDNDGNVATRKDARQTTATYTYDALNRLTSVSYSDGTPTVDYYYDQTSYNGLTISNGIGRRTGMSDGSGETAWSYDAMGRILEETKTIAGIAKTITYTYNLDGSLASLTYPDGHVVNYTYSPAARPISATDSSVNYATGAVYWPQGTLESDLHGQVTGGFAGITESWTYNSDLEPASITATSSAGTALSQAYNYAYNGSVTAMNNGNDSGRDESMTYDPLDRILTALTAVNSGQDCWGLNFGDDALGNLLSMSPSKCTSINLSVSVNGNNHITSPTGYTYDAAGNLTGDGSHSYAYNAENEITSAGGVNYTYDGDGLRVKKSSGTLYWRSYTGQVLEETDTSGNMERDYIFFAGRRIAWRDSSGNVYYYFADALSSTRAVTDATGNTCFEADYYPYGQENDYNSSCSPTYKFAGYEFDSETGNYYAYARYYDPSIGRFLSADPLAGDVLNPQSLNRYSYVVNNPETFVDPLGMSCSMVGGVVVCETDMFEGGGTGGAGDGTGAAGGAISDGTGGGVRYAPLQDVGQPRIGGGGGRPPQTQTCSVGNASASLGQWFWGVVAADHMFIDFATGLGPGNREFGPSSAPSQLMASSPGVTQAVDQYLSSGKPTGLYTFGLGGAWNAGLNPVQQYVGSYRWSVAPTNGGLLVTLSNTTSVRSGSYHLLPNHSRPEFGPLGNTHQTYQVFVPCHP